MLKKNKVMKLLSLGFLTLVLGFSVACGNSNSSEVDSSSEEVSSEVSSEEVSSEDTNKEPVYSIDIGGTKITLTKGEGTYETTLESVNAGTEVNFYKDNVEIYPGCAELGNNIILNAEYKTEIHNNASNVKLTLFVSQDGAEVWLEGYQVANVLNYSAKVNGESKDINVKEVSGQTEITITLEIKDVLEILGDGENLYFGTNAMSYVTEYEAPLPGEYKIKINEYNRLEVTEPVLEVEDLYLTYINEVQIKPTFVTPDNSEDRAQFNFDLKKGEEFIIKYIDGTTLGSGSAVLDCSYTIYINKDGQCYPTMSGVSLNITATADEKSLSLTARPAGDNFAVYLIEVEAGQVITFYNDGEALTYHDSKETTFSYETSGTYIIYINKSLQVWDEPFVPVTYREVTVSGVEAELINNRAIYTWAWESNKDGAWMEKSPKVNEDGTLTVYLATTADNFLLITTEINKLPDWGNMKSQTNDTAIALDAETVTVTWKTKEKVNSGTQPKPDVTTGNYGLRGTFDGGDWGTTTLLTKVSDDIYELEITATAVSEFKVVIVKADDVNYVEEWIGNNGDSNFQIQPGTYKVTYKVSTKTVTCVAK